MCFCCLWQLCMKVVQLPGFRGPWWCQVCRDTGCLCCRSYGPSFMPLVAGDQTASLASLSCSSRPVQALRGLPCLGSFSVVPHQAHRGGPPAGALLCSFVHQALKEAPWLGSYPAVLCWRVGREAMVMAPPATRDSAVSPYFRGCPAFLHRHFPPQSPPSHPSIRLSTVNRSPRPGIAPQSLNSSSQALVPSRGSASLSGVCMAAARTV